MMLQQATNNGSTSPGQTLDFNMSDLSNLRDLLSSAPQMSSPQSTAGGHASPLSETEGAEQEGCTATGYGQIVETDTGAASSSEQSGLSDAVYDQPSNVVAPPAAGSASFHSEDEDEDAIYDK